MNTGDIFSALGKYKQTEENYLTEAFVFLISSLLESALDHLIGIEILNQLCAFEQGSTFDPVEKVSVVTQEVIEVGKLDIKIQSPDKLIYVEVKDYSPVNPQQLKKYRIDLDSHNIPTKRLVLLTRFFVDSSEHKNLSDRQVRWSEVYNWLTFLKVQDPISRYLINSFISFLEVKQMSMQKVGWEYVNGVPAFNNLIDMIEVAIRSAGIPFSKTAPKGFGWDYRGFSMEGGLWCGIVYSDHLYLIFEIWDKQKYDQTRVKQPTYPVRDNNKSIFFDLIFENVRFFCLDKDKQLEEITKFIKTAYAEAQQMMVK